ncbi:MAG: insulinase family protein, partial [Syntrophorhabdaceae bacterium]|nr:insulinase family protein [Syntrophorhabdaceae bacterium]
QKKEAEHLIKKYFSKKPETYEDKKDSTITIKKQERSESIIERDVKENYLAVSFRVPDITHEDIPALDVLSVILGSGDSSRLQEQLKYKKGIVTGIGVDLFAPKYDGIFLIYSTFSKGDYNDIVKEIEQECYRLKSEGVHPWELIKAKNILNSSFIYAQETAQGKAMQLGKYFTLTGKTDFIEKYLKKVDSVKESDIKRVLVKYILGKEKKIAILRPANKEKNLKNPHTFTLKNKMKCIVNKNTNSPSFAFRIGFVGGVKEEPEGKNGIFNILSRMLLKGTSKKDAITIAREIDLLAGDITPFSGKNTFGLSGKFLSKDIKTVINLLSELIKDPVFKEDELKRVKDEVLSEIRQKEDDPISFTFMRFREAIFQNHPYAKDPDGNEKDILNITNEDLSLFYKKYVTPEGAVLAISGDVDEKVIKALFEEYFSDFNGGPVDLRKVPAMHKKQSLSIKKEMAQRHLIFGFLGPGIIDRDRYAVEVMAAILSGMGGRIHRILREENPYAYALTFFNRQDYETGSMGIYIGTDGKYIEDVKRIAKEELKRIAEKGFTTEEIKNAKNRLIGNNLITMQSNINIATEMCLDTIYGLGPDYFKRWHKYIEQVTDRDVNDVAKKYIDLEKMVFIEVGG